MRTVNTKGERCKTQTQQECRRVLGLLTAVGSRGMCPVAEAAGFYSASMLGVMASLQVTMAAYGCSTRLSWADTQSWRVLLEPYSIVIVKQPGVNCRVNGGAFGEESGGVRPCCSKWDPSISLARTVSLGLWVSNMEEAEGLADNQVRYCEPDPCGPQRCAGQLGGGSPEEVSWRRHTAEQGRVR